MVVLRKLWGRKKTCALEELKYHQKAHYISVRFSISNVWGLFKYLRDSDFPLITI